MDAGGIGALIGISTIIGIGLLSYICDKCVYKRKVEVQSTNPLLVKKRSFKVKNLFNHVQI